MLINGKLLVPQDVWFIGTANKDDSTFTITDKVYDRAMPIDINIKVDPFKCREQEAIDINASYLESLFDEAKEKYPYGTPFTKESLLYRDIFEEFYPDSSKWIKDFWMPNKTWEHCDVNDPSARFLDNYGDSGK